MTVGFIVKSVVTHSDSEHGGLSTGESDGVIVMSPSAGGFVGSSVSSSETNVSVMPQRAANTLNCLLPEAVKQIPTLLLFKGTYLFASFPFSLVHWREMESAEMEQLALESPSAWHCWENTCGMKMLIGASGKYQTSWRWIVWMSLRSSSILSQIDPMSCSAIVSPLTPKLDHSSFLVGKGNGSK